jgi:hypothetical protein
VAEGRLSLVEVSKGNTKDIVIVEESAGSVGSSCPTSTAPQPKTAQVACDHCKENRKIKTHRSVAKNSRRQFVRSGTSALGAAVILFVLITPVHPLLAAADGRNVASHRWHSPSVLAVPATSALALAGAAGLGFHLFRRRRADEKRRDLPTQDADWERRIAIWERRLRSDGDGVRSSRSSGEDSTSAQASSDRPAHPQSDSE